MKCVAESDLYKHFVFGGADSYLSLIVALLLLLFFLFRGGDELWRSVVYYIC